MFDNYFSSLVNTKREKIMNEMYFIAIWVLAVVSMGLIGTILEER